MKINIQRFFIYFLIIFTVYFYTISTYYFYEQEEERASIILKNFSTHIEELSYSLSKELKNKKDINQKRAQFERIVANDDFINSIVIFDDNNLLFSTNPDIKEVDTLTTTKYKNNYEKLKATKYISSEIRFYENEKEKKLLLIYVLQQDEINSNVENIRFHFIISFVLFFIIAFVIELLLLRKYVSSPLEALRQYAYYNNEVPKKFRIKELETIRYSMVDTFSRLEKEKRILYNMARTDSLSGLANRNSLNEFLERLIPDAKRNKKEFAYLFLDIDNFKSINDSLGHNIGDELLQNISKKIELILRPQDFVARIGGDEFVIILQNYHNLLELTKITERVQKCVSTPWLIKTNPITINCSIGIAIFPNNGKDTISLMKNSDIAMYEAKKLGKNQYHFFNESLNAKVQRIIHLTKDMEQALVNNEYELYYQPKVDVFNSQIKGVEALIRWIHPIKGVIPPSEFIALAEENGFIKELGQWVIDNALNKYLSWKEKGIDITISLNISAQQLEQRDFALSLIKKLDLLKIPHNKIDLEITEYMFLEPKKDTLKNLQKLQKSDISISLDDFGTGYSSLSYLKKYPFNNLKIDKSFLDGYDTKEGAVFLETIVKMAQTLDMNVIAEGVEDNKQLEYLKEISCNEYQGYYFSKPLKSEDFEKLYFRIMS